MEKFIKKISLLQLLILFTVLLISGFIYKGFFYPDQIFINANPLFKLISKLILIVFPLFVLIVLSILYLIMQRKVRISSVVLSAITFLILILLIYPFGEYFYKKRYRMNLEKYHTFLQLTPNLPDSVSDNKFNIFCLGGSTTEFKDKKGRDWPSLTESILKSKLNTDSIRIFNLGKQWYTTQHSLINYIQNLRKLHPDVLIIMHNINDLLINADFSRFSNGKFRDDYGHFLGPEAFMIKYGSLAEFVYHSLKLLWYRPNPIDVEASEFPGVKSFKRNLLTLIELARLDGTKVILITQPNIYKDKMKKEELNSLTMLNKEAIGDGIRWSYNSAYRGITLYNDTVRDLAIELNLPLIDLDKVVPKSLDYFYDDVHYNDKTYDLISDFLSDELIKVLELQ